MDLDIGSVARITEAERQRVLAEFSIPAAMPLATGTEAEVYRLPEDRVLKLYAGAGRLAHFETLRDFYATVDTAAGLRLPYIHTIAQRGDLIAVIERFLPGRPLADRLPHLSTAECESAQALYFDTAWRLREITLQQAPQRYLLFDKARISAVSQGPFETFYARFLQQKAARVSPLMAALCPDFPQKAAELVQAIAQGDGRPPVVVHGDFFPGNVLVEESLDAPVGVIDFGSFTMFGDFLIDIAGAFAFYEMYDPQRVLNRRRLLPALLQRLTAAEQPRFFQYLLAHAVLTCDLYAGGRDPRQDAHFLWAAEIVCTDAYWAGALA